MCQDESDGDEIIIAGQKKKKATRDVVDTGPTAHRLETLRY